LVLVPPLRVRQRASPVRRQPLVPQPALVLQRQALPVLARTPVESQRPPCRTNP
jgi:hypothetical protein